MIKGSNPAASDRRKEKGKRQYHEKSEAGAVFATLPFSS